METEMYTFWLVEETVTDKGHYITWPNSYNTKEEAEAAIANDYGSKYCRAVLYQTGRGYGPERFTEKGN